MHLYLYVHFQHLKKLYYPLYISICSLPKEWGLVHLPDLSSHNMGLHIENYSATPLYT